MTATFTPTVAEACAAGFVPGRRSVEIVDNRQLADAVWRLTFRDAYTASHARPAQFVNLYSPDPLRMSPRPFGVAATDGDLVSVIFAVVGSGTEAFSALRAGDHVDMLGPLGKPFNLKESGDYLLVGGGLGIPPLLKAAQALHERDDATATAVFGYRDRHFADGFAEPLCEAVHSIDESEGNVLTILEQEGFAAGRDGRPVTVLSCGPLPMMKAVAAWAGKRGLACQLSMEQRMGCGYGTCVVCTIDTASGRQKVCVDGPVFTAQQLGWN